ncbi:MAG: macro domain-containing protein [Rhizobiales bacterium]|nr:macro domain-containing protein [Hyphomicrobiales bacterium]
MALTFKTGNMFEERAEAIVNTVNCVGVMGKGVALEFKRRWPENFSAYKRLCNSQRLRPGKVYVHQNTEMFHDDGRKFLVNFPTKDHWRSKSRMEFIESGLDDLVEQIQRLRIRSVVLPPLGCGNGGLDWSEVRDLITFKLSQIADVDFVVFAPVNDGTEEGKDSPGVRMTFERALLLKAFNDLAVYFDGSFTHVSMQELVYLLQEMGAGFGLTFSRKEFGPYSDGLQDAFVTMKRQGLIAGFSVHSDQIVVTSEGIRLAEEFLQGEERARADTLVQCLSRLIEGYESPYGLELLSSVHFVAHYEDAKGVEAISGVLGGWSARKGLEFNAEMLGVVIDRLNEDRLLG